MQTSLTIVILTYNSEKVIKSCLDNINFGKYKVIIVDNASIDETLQIVEKNFPQVELLKLDKNYGYGRGNNYGLNLVQSEFALVLNPDAKISEDDIDLVVNSMKQDEKAALAGCINLETQAFDAIEYQKKIDEAQQDFLENKKIFREKIGENFYVKFIVGAGLFMKMSAMRQIGFFDKNIFLYYEDDEICKRATDSGYKNLIVTKAAIMHVGGGSTSYNLRLVYKAKWHLAWSKLHLKQIKRGCFSAKKSALQRFIEYFFKALCSFEKKKFVVNLATSMGSLGFLIGLKAFDKNDNPRG